MSKNDLCRRSKSILISPSVNSSGIPHTIMLLQLFISADFFHQKVEPCTVRWGLRANKLPSSFLCMSSHNWNWTIIFSNMVLHFGSTRKCTLRDIQTLCDYNIVMPSLFKVNVYSFYLFYFWRRKLYWLRWDDI